MQRSCLPDRPAAAGFLASFLHALILLENRGVWQLAAEHVAEHTVANAAVPQVIVWFAGWQLPDFNGLLGADVVNHARYLGDLMIGVHRVIATSEETG